MGPVASAEQALAVVRSERVDVAILDWQLKDQTSECVAAELTQRGVPFIFYSGNTPSHTSMNHTLWVPKPSSHKLVVERLRLAMSAKKQAIAFEDDIRAAGRRKRTGPSG